jgi:hypothetical protein
MRVELRGDPVADAAAVAACAPPGVPYCAVTHPLLVDDPDPSAPRGKRTRALDCAFVYLLEDRAS